MTAVGEIIGISVGLGVVTLGLVWASVLKWKAEDRKERAERMLKDKPKMIDANDLVTTLPVGKIVEIDSSWGLLARETKLLGAEEQMMDGRRIVLLRVQDSGDLPRMLPPILISKGQLVGIKIRVL